MLSDRDPGSAPGDAGGDGARPAIPGLSASAANAPRPISPERPATMREATDGRAPDAGAAITDEPAVAAAGAGADAVGADLGRRRFFREIATEVFHTAATVVGAATALQRSSMDAASAILNPAAPPQDVDEGEDTAAAPPAMTYAPSLPPRTAPLPAAAARARSGPPIGYHSAFRVEDDRVILVNQRRLPLALVDVECRTGLEIANEIRDRTIAGGPAIAQAAALGLALTAQRVRGSRPYARRAILRATATTLADSRPSSRQLRAAVERVMARYRAIGELDEDGAGIADAMTAEAEAVVFEANDDHGRLVEAGLARLPDTADRPLSVLTLGSTGTMGGGQFGTALGVIQAASYAGRPVHVHVLEGRPGFDGARVAAWELLQANVPQSVVADAAAGWLLQSGQVDVVLVGAAAIAANGDIANEIGTYAVASIADRHGVPVIVCAPLAALDAAAPDGAALAGEERPPVEILEIGKVRVPPADVPARNPVVDVTPAALITAFATEEGILDAPFGPALSAALAARERRRNGSADVLDAAGVLDAVEARDAVGRPDDAALP